MVILSASSYSTLFALKARVSSSLYLTSSSAAAPAFSALCFLSLRSSTVIRRRPKSVLFCSSKAARAVVELVEDKESTASTSSELGHSRTFLDARSGEDLLSGIQREKEAGRLPLNVAWGMEELYHNYRDAVFQSRDPKADEIILSNMAVALDRIFMVVKDPFVFSPYHMAIREPFDYYMFAQKYICPLIDFRHPLVDKIIVLEDVLFEDGGEYMLRNDPKYVITLIDGIP